MSKMSLAASVLVAGAAGWTTRDVLVVEQMVVTDSSGRTRLTLAVDPIDGPMIQMLDPNGKEVRRITSRLEGSSQQTAGSSSVPVASRRNSGRLLAVETIGPDEQSIAEAETLRSLASAAERTATELDARAESLRRSGLEHSVVAQQANNKRDEARDLNRRAQQMLRGAREIRQVLLVWTGGTYAILETTRDLSRRVSEIGVGGFFQWTGDLTAARENIRMISIRDIETARMPRYFSEEPNPAERPSLR